MSTAGPAQPSKPPIPDDPARIEEEIAARQARLAATVDELTTRLSPKEIARRSAAGGQQRAKDAVYAEDGSLRIERVGAVAAAAAALVAVFAWRRSR